MTNQQLDEEAIFHVARQIPGHEARATYLDQVCAGDQALRERVEALLDAHEQESKFLKSSPDAAPTAEHKPINEGPGQQIGRFKLLQQIGEGGFGVVYMAEQVRPVRRKVALKIIKPGMDTHAVVARFEAERQALAMMDHPNIARVLDGGATDSGRPYFVMELVRGVPITEYCDKNNLPTNERLELFTIVCQAVQHAHQKGIIHRDLKPSNILVTLADGKPVVKVIDFGVSKALNQQLTEKTLFTAYGQMIGTPQYMSPEQAEMSCLDVDTRSDIYSLGVVLYELLTGTTPLEGERLRTAGFAEMQRIIQEEEPPKPSVRLSTSGEKLTVVAKHRSVTPQRLHKIVRGDLDWIVMKALEKERARRYETANGLAADVQRVLDKEVVEARPPSAWYQLRKFYSRNKTIAVSTALVVCALTVGLVGALWGIAESRHSLVQLRHSQAELSEALADKESTLSQLTDEITGRALNLAMLGAFEQAEEAIEDARSAGFGNEGLLKAILGLAHLYDGRTSEAMHVLAEATTRDKDSIAAWSGYWLAALYTGKYEQMSEARQRIDHIRAVRNGQSTDTEKLFLAQLNRHTTPVRTEQQLTELLNDHPMWGAVHALRGRARINIAKDRYRESVAVDLFQDAIADFEQAAVLTPDSEFLLTDYLFALLEASEFAEHYSLDSKLEEWTRRADTLADSLGQPTTTGGYGFNARMGYLAARDRFDELESHSRKLAQNAHSALLVRVAELFWENRLDEARHLLLDVEERSRPVEFLTVYQLMFAGSRQDAIDLYNEHFVRTGQVTDIEYIGAETLWLLAQHPFGPSTTCKAAALCQKLGLSSCCSLIAHFSNPSQEREQELLELAGPFSREQQMAYHAIGVVAFAEGHRAKAIRCFDRAMEAGRLDHWWHLWPMVLKKRMEDPCWPHWIAWQDPATE